MAAVGAIYAFLQDARNVTVGSALGILLRPIQELDRPTYSTSTCPKVDDDASGRGKIKLYTRVQRKLPNKFKCSLSLDFSETSGMTGYRRYGIIDASPPKVAERTDQHMRHRLYQASKHYCV